MSLLLPISTSLVRQSLASVIRAGEMAVFQTSQRWRLVLVGGAGLATAGAWNSENELDWTWKRSNVSLDERNNFFLMEVQMCD
eukprot:m.18130 g.18130  ORF g.18130 m.18130 type:complete len:83 (+) comp27600_c0_seq1:654-902(+)